MGNRGNRNHILFAKREKSTALPSKSTFDRNHEYYPIPANEISLSVGADGKRKLIQNPGY
jgi:hypothetical protein